VKTPEPKIKNFGLKTTMTFGTKFIKRFKNLKKDDMIIYKEHIIEDLWENVEAMIDAQALDILVIDSIGALQTNQESEKTMDESTVAALPKKLNTINF
jgi:RecA/RadA recombinase